MNELENKGGSPNITDVYKQIEELVSKIKKESDELRTYTRELELKLALLAKDAGRDFKSRHIISGGNLCIGKLPDSWGIFVNVGSSPRHIFEEGRENLIEFVEIFPKFLDDYLEELKRFDIKINAVVSKVERMTKSITEEDILGKNLKVHKVGIPIFADYNGKIYKAIFLPDLSIDYEGINYKYPSKACQAIVSWSTCNGWDFWKFKRNGEIHTINFLRNKNFEELKQIAIDELGNIDDEL